MFASFSSTESGCDQCADLSTAFSSPVQNVTNSVNQYAQGLNNNQQSSYHNNVMQSNSIGLNQNSVNNLNNNLNTLQPPVNTYQQPQQSNGQVAMQQMVQKAIQKPNVNNVRGPVANNNSNPSNNKAANTTIEPFETLQSPVQVNIPSKLILLNLVTVILLALSINESFKYYINRGLAMSEGTPHYYAFYTLGAIILAVAMYFTSIKLSA